MTQKTLFAKVPGFNNTWKLRKTLGSSSPCCPPRGHSHLIGWCPLSPWTLQAQRGTHSLATLSFAYMSYSTHSVPPQISASPELCPWGNLLGGDPFCTSHPLGGNFCISLIGFSPVTPLANFSASAVFACCLLRSQRVCRAEEGLSMTSRVEVGRAAFWVPTEDPGVPQ